MLISLLRSHSDLGSGLQPIFVVLLVDLNQSVINKPNAIGKFMKCVPKDTFFSIVGHSISLPNVLLMHDVMNDASSHNADLDQFHMDASYLMTFSCFMWRLKFKIFYLGVNFNGLLDRINTSFSFMQDKKKIDLKFLTLKLNPKIFKNQNHNE
jgi:hypothetical protein